MMSTHPSRVITYRKTEKESVRTRVNQNIRKHQSDRAGTHRSGTSQDPPKPVALLLPVGLGYQQRTGLRFPQESGTIKMIKHYKRTSQTLVLSHCKEVQGGITNTATASLCRDLRLLVL